MRRRMSSGTFGRPSGSRSYGLRGLSAAMRSGLLKIMTTPPSTAPNYREYCPISLRRPRCVTVALDRIEIEAHSQPRRIRNGQHTVIVKLPGLSHDGVDVRRAVDVLHQIGVREG